MTDHNREEREALIEKAAKAIDPEAFDQPEDLPFAIEEARSMARAALAVFEQAHAKELDTSTEHVKNGVDSLHVTPTDDEREALRVASPVTWGWDACVVCGSRDVTDRGMVVMVSKADGAYVGRIAWCDGSQECRDDLRQAGASMLTEDQAEAVDAALRHSPTPTDGEREALELLIAMLREANHPEGLDSWPSGAIAHAILAAGFRRTVQGDYEAGYEEGFHHGRSTPREAVQGEPTVQQVEDACTAFYEHATGLTSWARLVDYDKVLANRYRDGMRRALRAVAARGEGRP